MKIKAIPGTAFGVILIYLIFAFFGLMLYLSCSDNPLCAFGVALPVFITFVLVQLLTLGFWDNWFSRDNGLLTAVIGYLILVAISCLLIWLIGWGLQKLYKKVRQQQQV